MGATWSFSHTYVAGNVLTAAQLNTTQSDVINNFTPAGLDDASVNTAAMKVVADPGEVGTESLATSLEGEIQRLRNIIKEITGEAQWYVTPDTNIATLYLNTPVSATNWPSFSAYLNATQANITGVDKIDFDTEEFDNGLCFGADALGSNAGAGRFAPGVAGKYLITVKLNWESLVANDILRLFLYKNGAIYKRVIKYAVSTADTNTLTLIIDVNGTTDYFEIYAENANRDTADTTGTIDYTSWSGCRIG